MSPHDRRSVLTAVIAAVLVCALISLASSGDSLDAAALAAGAGVDHVAQLKPPADGGTSQKPAAAGVTATTVLAAGSAAPTTVASATSTELPGLDGSDLTNADTCVMTVLSLRHGESGDSVKCLQTALLNAGFYTGAITGSFDQATFAAVEKMQTDRNLFVDGVVGRETAISLAIWPDEESLVIRTPKPPAGAKDLMGYPLSSVSSSGPDAPPLPPNSGSGKRLVYERAGQRIWAVDKNERVIRSWLVSGSKYSNELPGTHQVYSKSDVSTAWNGKAWLPKMVRWLKTDIGAIGFHAIPLHVEDNSPYMKESELGTRLSGGCQRQANADAAFVWDFADIGTKVVVI
jgi:peptidoglycan hydrolase-like protein with peptidoglycan-binding domain